MKVLELMRTHVVSAQQAATLGDAIDMMDLYQLTSLPVVDEHGRLVGVLEEREAAVPLVEAFCRHGGELVEGLRAEALQHRALPISDRMRSPAEAADENDEALDAACLMLEQGLDRLPVTSQGRLIGVISRIDVCQAVLEALPPPAD